MRLLQGGHSYGPFGGVERYIRELALHLREAGHEVHILTSKLLGEERDGLPVHVVPDMLEFQDDWTERHGDALRRIVDEVNPDLIHLHSTLNPHLTDLCRRLRPTIRSVHDHSLFCPGLNKELIDRRNCTTRAGWRCFLQYRRGGCICWHPPWSWAWPLWKRKMREIRANRRLPRLITPSAYMRRELLAVGFRSRQVEVNELYVDSADRGGAPPPVPRSGETPRILCVSRMVLPDKGVDFLLESLARVRGPFRADLVGHGPHHDELVALHRRLGLEDRVTFHGWVDDEAKDRFYREADLFAFPATWLEPVGFVGFEAMVYGLPVVALDVGGIGEWLTDGENGLLAPWMDPDAYAAALDRLLADPPLRRRMGASGRALVSRRFRREDHIARLERTYREVLARDRGRR